jgi:hypothetical protein
VLATGYESAVCGEDAGVSTVDAPAAFVLEPVEPLPLQIRVNFGIFTGRDATRPELERLASRVLERTGSTSVIAQQRYVSSPEQTACLHEVLIEVPPDGIERSGFELETLEELLLADARTWLEECVEHPDGPMSLAERLGTATVSLDS